MATSAIFAEATIVDVVRPMAVDTSTNRAFIRNWLEMALMAVQFFMRAFDIETGLTVVEFPNQPVV